MRKNNYQTWKNDGILQSKLKLIKELASRSCGMGVIATELGISENTLYSLRKKYKDVEKSYEDGRNMLKKSLLEKMFERAMGFTIVNEDQIIEQTPTGTKKMNENIINVISVLVTSIVLPLITFLGIKLTSWLNTKIKDEKSRALLTRITEVVTRNVASTFQTFVESLKKENKFDEKFQSNALRYTKEQILKELSDEAIEYISDNFKDVNSWLTTQIESTIYTLKK